MCLVLKLDSEKIVSIAHEQTDRHTKSPSILHYYIDDYADKVAKEASERTKT